MRLRKEKPKPPMTISIHSSLDGVETKLEGMHSFVEMGQALGLEDADLDEFRSYDERMKRLLRSRWRKALDRVGAVWRRVLVRVYRPDE
ncbi:MAG: hypothetical protein FWC87_00165 [Acidimicrobiaceae bacterium]|nr:hypothetical protein [Acidimicrobiaceae bacterium]